MPQSALQRSARRMDGMEVDNRMEEQNNKNAAMRIMEALSGVDEELLERCGYSAGAAAPPKGRRRTAGVTLPVRRWTQACAAVLCLLVAGAVSWGGYQLRKNVGNDASSYSGGANREAAGEYNDWMENEKIQQNAGGTTNGTDGAEADGCLPESAGQEGSGGDSDGMGSHSESALPKDENGSQDAADGEDGLEESGGLLIDSCVGVPNTVTLSEEEARNWETLGNYIPTALPQGYVFEGASYNEDTERLAISWRRGMDLIIVGIGSADSVETVDVGRPETYDERLYEIPYASSVPPEYRESFDNPVFAVEDLELEIVKSRIVSHNDSGDTDTPRGNFSVLFPDGVLLRFNGRGTPEQIWEMICSISG